MIHRVRNIDAPTFVAGLILVFVGAIFLVADFQGIIRGWWPMIPVLIGIPMLLRRSTVWPGLWLIALGAWFQLVKLHLFDLTFRNSWPLLLIVFGAGIALRAAFDVLPTGSKEEHRES